MSQRVTAPIQSIQRAAAILRSFTEREPELGVTVLSRRLGLHKSTVSRILATLQKEGLVGQNPETGKYRLGVGLISLAGVALGRLNVRGVAQPHLDKLMETSQETINVAIVDGQECVTIEHIPSPQSLRYVGWIGRRMPFHATACGQILLAYASPEERAAMLRFPLTKYTGQTTTDAQALEATLAETRRQGYAIVHEAFSEGFSAISAPVHNHAGQVVAAISIAGPTFRMGNNEIVNLIQSLLDTAQTVSAELGYFNSSGQAADKAGSTRR